MGAVDLVDPDRVAAERGQRAAARRPRRPPGRRGLPRACSSPSTAATSPRPRSPSSGCAPARSSRCGCPTNPLDVLAQQVVAATALDAWPVDDLFELVRRSAPFTDLPRSAVRRHARPAQRPLPLRRVRRAAAPDRLGPGRPARSPAARAPSGWPSPAAAPSPTAACSACSWSARRADPGAGSASSTRRWSTSPGSATSSRSAPPAGGSRTSPTTGCWSPRPRACPAGCRSGRATRSAAPPSSARRSARFTRELGALPRDARRRAGPRGRPRRVGRRQPGRPTSPSSVEATSVLPSDRTLVVERFRDELGDWRLVVHSPYGTPVHAPWALAINARLRERYGVDGQAMASDDGIVIRIPDTDAEPPGGDAGGLRARRDRGPRHRRGRRLGAVRLPVPRVRRPGPAAPPPRPRPPLAAVAAAAALGRSCSRSPRSTPPSRSCSRPSASASRTSTTCPRWSR